MEGRKFGPVASTFDALGVTMSAKLLTQAAAQEAKLAAMIEAKVAEAAMKAHGGRGCTFGRIMAEDAAADEGMKQEAREKGWQTFEKLFLHGSEALLSAELSIIFFAVSFDVLGSFAKGKTVFSLLLSLGSWCGRLWEVISGNFY